MGHLDKSLVVMALCACSAPLWSHGFLPTPQPEDLPLCNNKCCAGLAWFPWWSMTLRGLKWGLASNLLPSPPIRRRGALKPEAGTLCLWAGIHSM